MSLSKNNIYGYIKVEKKYIRETSLIEVLVGVNYQLDVMRKDLIDEVKKYKEFTTKK